MSAIDRRQQVKRCAKCMTEKPASAFYASKSSRNGLQSNCKECAKAIYADWYIANRKHKNLADAAWRAENPEKVRALRSSWFSKNPQKVKAAAFKWRSKNKGHIRSTNAAWRAANRPKKRIYNQNRRAHKNDSKGRLSPGLSERLLKLQRGKCACCRRKLGGDYQMDHQMPVALGGPNEDWNIQLLCPKCNLSKRALHPIDFMQKRGFLL